MLASVKTLLRHPFTVGAGIFLLLCAVGAAGLAYLNSDTRREIDLLAIASSDNTPWNLSQGEIELQAFEIAILELDPNNPESIRAAKVKFDIFFSRIQQFKAAKASAHVMSLTQFELERIDAFIEETVALIDGPDQAFISAIPDIDEKIHALRPDLRRISLIGSLETSKRAAARRQQVFQALDELSVSILLLFALLIGSLIALLMMVIASRRKTSEIRLAEQRLKSIIATSLDAILVTDADGRLLDCNDAAENLFKAVHADALGKPIDDLFLECDESTIPEGTNHIAARASGLGPVMLRAQDTNGHIFPIEVTCASTVSSGGSIYVMFVRDISKRLAAERELVLARDHAVAGEKAKANLLAVMSHEMRTPLNGVLGAVELLSETHPTNQQQKLIDAMETSGRALMKHVNNVLDISRVDAGKMHVTSERFNLDTVGQQVIESLRAQAAERNNMLYVKFPDGPIGPVLGDQWRITQILINLLGNAIKFTHDGEVTLEIERHPGTDIIEFRVIDDGVGINEGDIEKIFEDFVTLDTSYDREVEGTGLGLGIVRRLVDLLEGEMGLESEVGEGSVFWLTLPLPAAATHAKTDAAEGAITKGAAKADAKAQILLVEDNEINRTLVCEMLAHAGYQTSEANDGPEGVEAAKTQKFDLIFMDVSMPGMDGITASKHIRSSENPNSSTPIVALTAHALEDDIERCLAAGMEEVLTKPVSINQLKEAVERHVKVEPPVLKTFGEGLNEVLGEDRATEISHAAISELQRGFDQLDEMRENGATFEELRLIAHKLAGTAGLLSDPSVHRQLLSLEQIVSHKDTAGIADQIARARQALEIHSPSDGFR